MKLDPTTDSIAMRIGQLLIAMCVMIAYGIFIGLVACTSPKPQPQPALYIDPSTWEECDISIAVHGKIAACFDRTDGKHHHIPMDDAAKAQFNELWKQAVLDQCRPQKP